MNAINKIFNSLNEFIKADVNVQTTNLSNELFETFKLIENCTSCKKDNINDYSYDGCYKLINDLESEKEEREKKKLIRKLNEELIKIDDILNRKVLCKGCKEKKLEKLINKCENEELARTLYGWKLNSANNEYTRWIPFNEFGNIEYLAKGGFGEVHKATWFGNYLNYGDGYKEVIVVLKRLYNSSDNILDILKEVV